MSGRSDRLAANSVGAAFAVGMFLYACSSPSRERSRSAESTLLVSGSAEVAPAGVSPGARYCLGELPPDWQAALAAGVQRHSPGEQRQIDLVAPDGSVFGETFVPGRRHVLYWSRPERRVATIVQKFDADDGSPQVLGASFDGRYLAYTLLRTMTSFDIWTLYVWDSVDGGAPREIARSPREWNHAISGPLNVPIMHAGQVIWVQAVGGADRETAIYSLDVAKNMRRTIRQGHPTAPLMLGEKLVWSESMAPGALTELRGVDIKSGDPVALPGPLAGLRGASFVAATARTVAWTDTSLHELWIWRTDRAKPERVLVSRDGYPLQLLQVAGDVVTWDDGNQQWILDLRSNGYAPLTPTAGARSSGGTRLRVLFAPWRRDDGSIERGEETMIDTAQISPLPGC